MKHLPLIALLAWIGFQTPVLADSIAPPVPWVKTTKRGDFLFKMVPSKWREEGEKYVLERDSFGVAYEVAEDGEFHELWRTEGWYAYASEGHLSEDGRYLVRIGPWASDQEEHTDLAIAFYDRGKLLKEYQVRELVKDPAVFENSVSHYNWLPEVQSNPNGFAGETFDLVVIDKTAYSFDYKTGEIISSEKDEEAQSHFEIWSQKQATEEKEGTKLLNTSSFKDDFRAHFEISGIEAMSGNFAGCSLKGKTWTADLKPKEKLPHDASIKVAFPIIEDKHLEVSMTSADLLGALKTAFEHPFIAKRFENGGATGIRLRTQGDRLHWNTPELIEFLEKTTGTKPKENELAHWGYLIIDAKEPSYTSVYLNMKTKELIYKDVSKSPDEPVLVDATGKTQK